MVWHNSDILTKFRYVPGRIISAAQARGPIVIAAEEATKLPNTDAKSRQEMSDWGERVQMLFSFKPTDKALPEY